MARCRVSFTDQDKTEHSAEVDAESLYEAVALAVADFREDPLLRESPAATTEFTVAVLRNPHRTQNQAESGEEVGGADDAGGSGWGNGEGESAEAAAPLKYGQEAPTEFEPTLATKNRTQ